MSSRQKYRKLVIANGERVTAKNSLTGMLCISDYKADGFNRVLVFERQEKLGVVDTESSKGLTARQRKKKSVNGSDESANKSLSFPGETAPSA